MLQSESSKKMDKRSNILKSYDADRSRELVSYHN